MKVQTFILVPVMLSLGALLYFSVVLGMDDGQECLQRLNSNVDMFSPCEVRSGLTTATYVEAFDINGLPLPALVTMPADGRPKGVIIDVIGGPGGQIDPTADSKMLQSIAATGYMIVTPAYAGTSHRSTHPNQSLVQAADEIETLSQSLSLKYPHQEQCLLGTSLGGYIIMFKKARSKDSKFLARNVVLINPLLSSPKKRYDNATIVAYLGKDPKTSPRRRFFYKSVYLNHSDQSRKSKKTHVLEDELFQSFFGKYFEKSAIISTNPQFYTEIIYSKNDRHRTLENINFYKEIRNAKLTALDTDKHVLSVDPNYEVFIKNISSAINACVTKPK